MVHAIKGGAEVQKNQQCHMTHIYIHKNVILDFQ